MIVVDTHVWIWWVSEPQRLSARASAAIEYARTVGVCPISCWELATKVRLGKLALDRPVGVWVKQALSRPRVTSIELTPAIAVTAGELDGAQFHGDPADRLIVASAIRHGAELVTKDRRIRAFEGVRSAW